MLKTSLVDYGVGNLKSVARAIEEAGGSVQLISEASSLKNADRVLLPGVGAFGHCVKELADRGLFEAVQDYLQKERPLLGICVGMQMLLDVGLEFGEHQGLGFIKGKVAKIPVSSDKIKLPHIGWNSLSFPANKESKNPIFSTINESEFFYFLHSFYAQPEDEKDVLAYTEYGGLKIPALIGRSNILGCQFHPEKSGIEGIKFIGNFLKN